MAYIREYTELTAQEKRQLAFKRRFKEEYPEWDDSMVLLTKLCAQYMPAGSRILDFGCGRGNFVIDELKDHFSEKIGFDVDQASVTGNVSMDQVVIGEPTRLPFEDNHFDSVVSLWVMEHVKTPEALFAEVYRVLRPGGVFAFVTPNRLSLLIFIRRLMSKRIADKLLSVFYGRDNDDVFDVYYRANTKETVRRLAAPSGFSVEALVENADPSYTSFGPLTYQISKAFSRWKAPWARPHLICVLRKPSSR